MRIKFCTNCKKSYSRNVDYFGNSFGEKCECKIEKPNINPLPQPINK